MKIFKRILLALGLLPFFLGLTLADWYYNPFTGQLDYFETEEGMPTPGAAGDIVYYDGADWQVLTAGANGLVLSLNAGLPTWIADANSQVGVDVAATPGYLGAAYNNGVLRADLNELTYTDGGDFITFGLANHATARAALGLAIGTDVAAFSHAMSTHSDEDTYNISTTGSATVTKGYIHGAETTASPGAAFTVDWTVKQVQRVTITGTTLDITFTNPAGPARLLLVVVQGDGDDTIDWTNEADIKWPGGVAPVLSLGAADVDIVSFYFDGTNYYGVANYDFN